MPDKSENTGQILSPYKTALLTAVILIFVMGISGGACLLFYMNTAASEQYRMELHQTATLNIAVQSVLDALEGVVGDLKVLSSRKTIQSLLVQDSAPAKAELDHEFMDFSRHKGVYDQVRILNAQGKEVVRVDFNGGRPSVVAADRLQNKGDRYYFTDAADAPSNAVCISAFDLNMENGRVERPLKPMIRFSQPIFGDDGRFLGVVVLNYLGKQVIDRIRSESRLGGGDLMLVRADGYWLLNADPQLEWGFMLPERGGSRFDRSYPKEWQAIAAGDEGRFSTANGLFAYKASYPFSRIADSRNCMVKVSPQSQKWLFIHHISEQTVRQNLSVLKKNLFGLWAVMALFAVAPAWLLSSAFLKRRQSQHQMWRMANFDALTGLFNRASFMHELEQSVSQSQRYQRKFILLYLDLDGFKQINDTLGHAAGDRVLQQTAERFQAALRATDCVARLGGDEFCILVREIGSAGDAAQVADKLIAALAAPFDLDGQTGRVGTSIGIACFPENGGTADGLLRIADQAMYAAKSGGKNRYCFPPPATGSELDDETGPAALN
jgi:diguanylate cyclase (GGDEF)-like protein